ncbi:UDP-N-acetylglucosamine pyrophosphorylase [Dermatophagoides farinae]|uniref:UDP-N-acetylglucosamine diphosphorylase n=1 Tax=Dermatophagoides farinae TaxID=6954 RepID=A0A922I9Y0_DERFA|nr:UDP-N-acetylglucosamine pyrophosphorylase [Dermatophagoides farinae]
MAQYNDVKNLLEKYHQEHLLRFYDDRNTAEQNQQLIDDINSVNFQSLCRQEYFDDSNQSNKSIDEHLEPLDASIQQDIRQTSAEQLEQYRKIGLEEISKGKVAVLLLAGGQGTRLGSSLPKGMFDVGLVSKKTLYQIQAERIYRLQEMAGKSAIIPWYIMASEHTIEPTIEFFKKHNYFNLDEKNIRFFEQDIIPCFTLDGKIILKETYKLARSPNGNGGLYEAISKKGILNDMQQRGIEHIHAYCVDNILVKVADPVFIGYCASKNVECGAKTVEKMNPGEAVGVICKVRGRYQVVEYSEVSKEISERRNTDGRLMFNAGNICNHYFTLKFLQDKVHYDELPYHQAKKKIPFVDNEGNHVKPDKPNGIKLEKFIFDVFRFVDVDKFAVWQVLREDEFSPLKNNDQATRDSPTTARLSLYNLHQRYVLKAGGKIIDGEKGIPVPLLSSPVLTSDKSHYENQAICEISPLLSYEGENLANIVDGKTLSTPVMLS